MIHLAQEPTQASGHEFLEAGMIGTTEWILIVAVIILLFGGRKLPELARAMGKSITEFKAGLKGEDDSSQDQKDKDRK